MKKIQDKDRFLSDAKHTLLGMVTDIETQPIAELKHLSKENTSVVIIDMINGFAKEGALFSDRIDDIIPYINKITEKFKGYKKIFFADTHTKDSIEFKSYPEHALEDSIESDIVEELIKYIDEDGIVVKKNSTNGFLCKDFTKFLIENSNYTNFIVMGCCTDICIMQFSLTLKAYFNEWNTDSRVIVPIDSVETFDLEVTNHNGDLMNVFALYTMKNNGVEIVSDIK